jgi:predicted AAA+ superfamily ATPase
MATIGRFLTASKSSFFLFGPRGTGKSTWLRQAFPEALWLDLLDPALLRIVKARPERLIEMIDGRPDVTDVVIDEIQKAPELLDVVHRLIEASRPLRFVLTGSSARKLRRGASNLLGGRVVQAEMHPFMAAELNEAFDLQRALQTGMVPLIWHSSDPASTLAAYAGLYLNEEVKAEALVRDIGAFARFLEAISFSHGSLLNLAAIARDCQVNRKTVEGYLSVLEDLLLAFRVPIFAKRAKRQLVAHEKFYYFDTGVFRSIRPAGPLDRPEEIDGAALEGLIAQHLRAWIAYRGDGDGLYFWRTKSGVEINFVVYGTNCFTAWEVKRSARVDKKDLRALKAFGVDYPEARLVLLYLGQERLRIDDIEIEPCEAFLRSLSPISAPVQYLSTEIPHRR